MAIKRGVLPTSTVNISIVILWDGTFRTPFRQWDHTGRKYPASPASAVMKLVELALWLDRLQSREASNSSHLLKETFPSFYCPLWFEPESIDWCLCACSNGYFHCQANYGHILSDYRKVFWSTVTRPWCFRSNMVYPKTFPKPAIHSWQILWVVLQMIHLPIKQLLSRRLVNRSAQWI